MLLDNISSIILSWVIWVDKLLKVRRTNQINHYFTSMKCGLRTAAEVFIRLVKKLQTTIPYNIARH